MDRIRLDQETRRQIRAVRSSIQKLEKHIDDSRFIPSTEYYGSIVIFPLLSKSLTVGRAVCALVEAGFHEEAFGLVRTLIEIYFTIRYVSNKDTETRAERFLMFFMKNHETWVKVIPKYYPATTPRDSEFHRLAMETAKNYRSPHEWSGEPEKTKSLAMEPSEFEFDADGKGTTDAFDYDIMYRQSSHFVHATISSLDSHMIERGDTFRIRGGRISKIRFERPLFDTLAFISKSVVCGYRALGYEQPEEILQAMHTEMKRY